MISTCCYPEQKSRKKINLPKIRYNQELLIRSESPTAIGTLVAGTAHELNNPLASTMSLIQSTLEDLSAQNVDTPLNSASSMPRTCPLLPGILQARVRWL